MKVLNLVKSKNNAKKLLINKTALNTWKITIKKMKQPVYFEDEARILQSDDIIEVRKFIERYVATKDQKVDFSNDVNIIRSKDSSDVREFIEKFIESLGGDEGATAMNNLCVSMVSKDFSISIETFLEMCVEATHEELALLRIISPHNNFKYIEKDTDKNNGIIIYFWARVDENLQIREE